MKLTFKSQLLVVVLTCLIFIVACTGQRASHLGYIYFSRDATIWRLDPSNDQETLLLSRFLTQGMSISPDGKWGTYPVTSETSHQESLQSIWIMDTRTGQETKISHNVPFVEEVWLPDSRLMIIEYPGWHPSSDNTTLIKGVARHTIFEPSTGQSIPAPWYVVPPDNGRILYAPTSDCAAERSFDHQAYDTLRVICVDVSEPITIATPLSLGNVAWSADGKLLAFYAGEETTFWDSWRLYIWRRDTNMLQEVDLDIRNALALSWSYDNQWLAFDDGPNLCVLRLADESVTCFENYLSSGHPVSWSPNSQSVVVATCASAVCEQIECDCSNPVLATIGIPNGEITELAVDVDIGFAPVWSSGGSTTYNDLNGATGDTHN